MDLANACRTCLQEIVDEPVWISTSIWEFLELELRMQRMPRVHPLLELPQKVCFECYRSLIAFKRFYTQCRDAEDFWKNKLDKVLVKIHDKVQDNAMTISHETTDAVDFKSLSKETNSTCVKEEMELLLETNDISMNVEDDVGDDDEEQQQEPSGDAICKTICKSEIHINSEFEANKNIELEDEAIKMVEFNESDEGTKASIENNKDKDDDDVDIKEADQSCESKRKRLQCQHCGRRFATSNVLRSHEYIHTGIKPFYCDVCGKSFRQKCVLRRHETLHFGKKIQCQECGQKFGRKFQLINHQRLHSNERPFQCDFDKCSASFREQQHLLAHQKIHSDMREHECEYCANVFHDRPKLLAHLHDVHGPNHYQCDLCVRVFNKPFKLRRHMQSIHDIELKDVFKYEISKSVESTIRDAADVSVCEENT